MINPYNDVDWSHDEQIISVSHAHTAMDSYYSESQQQLFFQRVANGGVRHFALSNYYPSTTRYPLSDFYQNIPSNAISCPNAEQHNFAEYSAMHINSLGSFFTSGSVRDYVDDHWVPRTPIGVNKATWQTIFPQIFAQLQYADGGGVTINHPAWSNLTDEVVTDMLDFDDRVLGIEIYNHSCELQNQTGWCLDWWDRILATGRKCWGFAVPDHTAEQGRNPWLGRNVLLVSEATEHECLKAYREGRFYSRLDSTSLKFTNISYVDDMFTVATEGANNITIVIDGQSTVHSGNSAIVRVPTGSVYIRAEAQSIDDRIFSNAITLREKGENRNRSVGSSTRNMLLY